MNASALRSLRSLLLIGGALATDAGCLIDVPGMDAGETGADADEACVSGENNRVFEGSWCVCDPGFEWCNNDQYDLNCCDPNAPETGDGETVTGDGDGDGTSGDGDGTSGDGDGTSGDGDGTT